LKRLTYLIGHRGASGYEPENTLRAFRVALEDGVNGIEFDVRQTRDGHLVIMHDETVDRTTNGMGYVNEMSLNELRQLDAGKGERVPTFEEVVDLAKGRCKMFVDIHSPGFEEDVVDAIRNMKIRRDVVVFGAAKSRIKELDSSLEITAEPGRFRIIACSHNVGAITAEMVSQLHEKGIIVIVGDIDREEDIICMIKQGVNGIITNWPKILVKVAREF